MDEMHRMQQEAARRVDRMQEHSRRVVEAYRERAAQPMPAPRLYDRPAPPPAPPSPSPVPSSGGLSALDGEQILLLVSDGVEEEQVLGICRENTQVTAEGLARDLLEGTDREDQDDATVVTIQLLPAKP